LGQRKERQGTKEPKVVFQECLKHLKQVLHHREISFYRGVYSYTTLQRQMCAKGPVWGNGTVVLIKENGWWPSGVLSLR
jgi:hypothetical protein